MFALETDYGSRVARFAVATTTIVLIAFSRIAVGLHFPVDVAVGVSIACGYLVLVLSIRERAAAWGSHTTTSVVFATVAVITVLAGVVASQVDATAPLGATLGAFLAWQYAPPPEPRQLTAGDRGRALAILVLVSVVGLVPGAGGDTIVRFLIGTVLGAVVVGLPRLIAAVGDGRSMWNPTG